jgi:hypothetical protein
MTEPDEALLWAREERVKFWEQSSASRKDIAMHVAAARAGDYDRNLHDDVYLRRSWLDGYRAGAAASDAKIKAMERLLGHFLGLYCGSAFWDVEKEPEVIEAIALLNDAEARALLKEGDQ